MCVCVYAHLTSALVAMCGQLLLSTTQRPAVTIHLCHSHHRGVPSFVTTLIIPPSHLAGLAPAGFSCAVYKQVLPQLDGSWHCVRGRLQLMAARAPDMQNT